MNIADWAVLVGMLSGCAFVTYLVNEVGYAIHSYFED